MASPLGIQTFRFFGGAEPFTGGNVVAEPTPQAAPVIEPYNAAAKNYADLLLKEGLSGDPVRTRMQGIGRFAQIVAGTIGEAQAERQRKSERDDLASKVDDPFLKSLVQSGQFNSPQLQGLLAQERIKSSAETRARKANAESYNAYEDAVAKAVAGGMPEAEARRRSIGLLPAQVQDDRMRELATQEKEARDAKRLQGLGDAKDSQDLERRILASGDPNLIRALISKRFATHSERSALNEKIAAGKAAGIPENLVVAQALGIPVDQMPDANTGNGVGGRSLDTWRSMRTGAEQKAALPEAMKEHGKTAQKINDLFDASLKQKRVLGYVQNIMATNAYMGPGYDWISQTKKIANSLGIKTEGVGEMQLLDSLANDMAKGARQGYPGSVSNFEMQTYLKSVISGSNTPEGNRAIMNYMSAIADENQAVAKDREDWLKIRAEKNLPRVMVEDWQAFAEQRARERYIKQDELLKTARLTNGLDPQTGQPLSRTEKLQGQMPGNSGAPTIINPQTGQRMTLPDGKWVAIPSRGSIKIPTDTLRQATPE